MYNEKDKYGLMFSDYLFSEIRKMEVIEYINFWSPGVRIVLN